MNGTETSDGICERSGGGVMYESLNWELWPKAELARLPPPSNGFMTSFLLMRATRGLSRRGVWDWDREWYFTMLELRLFGAVKMLVVGQIQNSG